MNPLTWIVISVTVTTTIMLCFALVAGLLDGWDESDDYDYYDD